MKTCMFLDNTAQRPHPSRAPGVICSATYMRSLLYVLRIGVCEVSVLHSSCSSAQSAQTRYRSRPLCPGQSLAHEDLRLSDLVVSSQGQPHVRMQRLKSQALPSAHRCSEILRCSPALVVRPHRRRGAPGYTSRKRCVHFSVPFKGSVDLPDQDLACDIRHVCRTRKHQGCSAQGQTFQEQIREITESLPVQWWPLFVIASACTALAAYTALQILLWDYRVGAPTCCSSEAQQ